MNIEGTTDVLSKRLYHLQRDLDKQRTISDTHAEKIDTLEGRLTAFYIVFCIFVATVVIFGIWSHK